MVCIKFLMPVSLHEVFYSPFQFNIKKVLNILPNNLNSYCIPMDELVRLSWNFLSSNFQFNHCQRIISILSLLSIWCIVQSISSNFMYHYLVVYVSNHILKICSKPPQWSRNSPVIANLLKKNIYFLNKTHINDHFGMILELICSDTDKQADIRWRNP